MKLKTALAAVALCALPVSGALAWGDRHSDSSGFTDERSMNRSDSSSSEIGRDASGYDNGVSVNQRQSSDYTNQGATSPMGGATPQVTQAQEALIRQGMDVQVTGQLDPQTERAILNYQVLNQLPITGQLDGPTLQSLNVS